MADFPTRIARVTLRCSDVEASAELYAGLVGLEIASLGAEEARLCPAGGGEPCLVLRRAERPGTGATRGQRAVPHGVPLPDPCRPGRCPAADQRARCAVQRRRRSWRLRGALPGRSGRTRNRALQGPAAGRMAGRRAGRAGPDVHRAARSRGPRIVGGGRRRERAGPPRSRCRRRPRPPQGGGHRGRGAVLDRVDRARSDDPLRRRCDLPRPRRLSPSRRRQLMAVPGRRAGAAERPRPRRGRALRRFPDPDGPHPDGIPVATIVA